MTAVITPLPSGEALLELGDNPARFPSWQAAADQADILHVPWHLKPFPPLSVDPPVPAP
ncbi:hypothetical protein [Actinoplanes sp. NPDC051494]|uniref:hypothetical protein n=1 Tax=Actinoplanes sp. NPDC051494 TaxID=3363907 RepID=UPI0037B3A53B